MEIFINILVFIINTFLIIISIPTVTILKLLHGHRDYATIKSMWREYLRYTFKYKELLNI